MRREGAGCGRKASKRDGARGGAPARWKWVGRHHLRFSRMMMMLLMMDDGTKGFLGACVCVVGVRLMSQKTKQARGPERMERERRPLLEKIDENEKIEVVFSVIFLSLFLNSF